MAENHTMRLWTRFTTQKLLDFVDGHLQDDFQEDDLNQICDEAATTLPHCPRFQCEYTCRQVRDKLVHLKKDRSKDGRPISWRDLFREGSRIFKSQSKLEPSDKLGDKAESPIRIPSHKAPPYEESCRLLDQNSIAIEPIYKRTEHRHPSIEHSGNDDISGQRSISEQQSLKDNGYIEYVAQEHSILDHVVEDRMQDIWDKMNEVIGTISSMINLKDIPHPQLDLIQKQSPSTSILLHHALSLPQNGSLSDKLALLGLGQLNLADWLRALIGIAIHDWVFKSGFPQSLCCPNTTIEMFDRALTRRDLHTLKDSLISDVRYEIAQSERLSIQEQAAQFAIDLGVTLSPILVGCDCNEALYGGANAGLSSGNWVQWRSSMQRLFVECLLLKMDLAVDGDPFEFKWFSPGENYSQGIMRSHNPQHGGDDAMQIVHITLMGAITAGDRSGRTISPAFVILT